ncbi:hypothetical protein CLS_15010 [[Clostridium] cf. saccharolyticum K10]|nr:hypothetical protein CLS_15010 [[Clostridium] cf. saccharolyticum K10]
MNLSQTIQSFRLLSGQCAGKFRANFLEWQANGYRLQFEYHR